MISQKRKRTILFLGLAFAACCLLAFAGCTATEPPQPAPTTYTATFLADGKLVAKVPYAEGDTELSEPAVPEKAGYTGVWEPYALTAGGITVNAIYTPIVRFTVNFDTNGGEAVPPQTVSAGDSLELPTPQKSGYLFLGWCVSAELDDAQPLSPGERYTPEENRTLYAKWRALNNYHFIFDSSTGTIRGVTNDSHPIDVVIPALIDGYDVKRIGDNAFKKCKTLTSVEIPDSVERIGGSAFYGCSALERAAIGSGVTEIGISAFEGCTQLGNVTIPDSVVRIGASAFSGCAALERVTIGSGVTGIGASAFEGCEQLAGVYIGDLAAWCSIDFEHTLASSWTSNPLHYAHKLYLNDSLLTDLVIPQGVTSIGRVAFRNCTSVTSVTLSDSVRSIGTSAFRNCSQIKSVKLSNGVTAIGSQAFANCDSLSSVTIPESVTSIEAFVFDDCAQLTAIWCEAKRKPTGWSTDWFKFSRPAVHWGDTWEYIDGVPTEKR